MNALGVAYASSSSDEDDGSEHGDVDVPNASRPTAPQTATAIALDGLPASPRGAADPAVQARIARFLEMQRAPDGGAKSFQHNLQTKKEVANPYILNKVVEYFGIDELHSNFDRAVFDPYGLPLHEYTDKIASEQKRRLDDRLAHQQQRSQIAFTHAKQTE